MAAQVTQGKTWAGRLINRMAQPRTHRRGGYWGLHDRLDGGSAVIATVIHSGMIIAGLQAIF
jgi:hypothetical protein